MWTELLSELAEITPTLPESDRAGAWLRIARLYGDKLGHNEYGLTSLGEALKRRRGERKELVAVLDEKAKRAEGEEGLAVRREVAELFADRLGDRKNAIARYEALRTETPRDLHTLRALERLYQAEGRHEE